MIAVQVVALLASWTVAAVRATIRRPGVELEPAAEFEFVVAMIAGVALFAGVVAVLAAASGMP